MTPAEMTPPQPPKIDLFIPPNITPVELFSGIMNSLRAIRNPTSNDEVFDFNSSCIILGLYQLLSSLIVSRSFVTARVTFKTKISQNHNIQSEY